jgi:hypothetical protein
LIPFIKETHSPWFLQFFTKEAKLRHATSKWDAKTRSVYSAEEAEIDGLLAEDEEMYRLDHQTTMPMPDNPAVEIHKPVVAEEEAFPKMYTDNDSVSTFNPAPQWNSTQASTVFTPKFLYAEPKETSEDSPAACIPADVIHSNSDVISKFLDAKTRISTLEVQFEAFV